MKVQIVIEMDLPEMPDDVLEKLVGDRMVCRIDSGSSLTNDHPDVLVESYDLVSVKRD